MTTVSETDMSAQRSFQSSNNSGILAMRDSRPYTVRPWPGNRSGEYAQYAVRNSRLAELHGSASQQAWRLNSRKSAETSGEEPSDDVLLLKD